MPLDARARLQIAKSDPEAVYWIFSNRDIAEDTYLYENFAADYTRYEQMLLDPQVRGKLGERVGALLGRSVMIDPATPSKGDKLAAETAIAIIDNHLTPYERICSDFLLSGMLIGFAVQAVVGSEDKEYFAQVTDDKGDPVLQPDGSPKTAKKRVIVPVLDFVPQRRFTFQRHDPSDTTIPIAGDGELDLENEIALVNGYELRLLTRRSPTVGERCNKNDFFTYTFGSTKGSPFGYGLGAMIRKFYEIRNECLKSGVLTGDRLGSPPTHGIYPATLDKRVPEDAELINDFTALLAAIAPNAYAATTEGFSINFPEAGTNGHEIIKWLYDTSGVEITRAIWGEGSYSEKDTGSYAADAQQAQNRNENIVDADCNSLDEQMGAQFWRWIAEKNYPKANAPRIRRETFSERRKHEEELAAEDLRSKKVTTDRTLILDLGLEVDQDYVSATYGEAFKMPNAVPSMDSLAAEDDTDTSAEEAPEDVPEEAPTEPVADQPTDQATEPSPEEQTFSEADSEDDLLDAYEARLSEQLAIAYGEAIAPIQSFIEAIASSGGSDEEKYRQFMDGIYDLYGQMDPGAIADVLVDGLISGKLAGMYSERIDRDD